MEEKNTLTDIWLVVVISLLLLLIGIFGFRYYENQNWAGAFYETATIMSLVGASHGPQTQSGKIFSGIYNLFVGLVYTFIIALVVVSFFENK